MEVDLYITYNSMKMMIMMMMMIIAVTYPIFKLEPQDFAWT